MIPSLPPSGPSQAKRAWTLALLMGSLLTLPFATGCHVDADDDDDDTEVKIDTKGKNQGVTIDKD